MCGYQWSSVETSRNTRYVQRYRGERIKLKYCCVKSSRRRIVDMNICDGRRDPRITSTTPQRLSREQCGDIKIEYQCLLYLMKIILKYVNPTSAKLSRTGDSPTVVK